MSLKIEHDIPLQPKAPARWRILLNKMKEGDSLLLSIKEERTLRTVAYSLGYKLSRREQPDGGFRVWLVSKK